MTSDTNLLCLVDILCANCNKIFQDLKIMDIFVDIK